MTSQISKIMTAGLSSIVAILAVSAPVNARETQTLITCVEEIGDPWIHVAIEQRANGIFAVVTENIDGGGDQIVLGEARVRSTIVGEDAAVTRWRSGNNRFRLTIEERASGDLVGALDYRHRGGRTSVEGLACSQE